MSEFGYRIAAVVERPRAIGVAYVPNPPPDDYLGDEEIISAVLQPENQLDVKWVQVR